MLRGIEPRAHVTIDEGREEIDIVAGPFDVLPTAEGADFHDHSLDDAMRTPMIVVPWPVSGGVVGFRVAAYSSDGTRLPRDFMHHLIAVNFARRQLVYPVPERLFGVGTETPDIRLPDFLEVPLARGDSIGFYAAWNNTVGREVRDVYLQVVLPYADESRAREQVLPIYIDANNHVGGKTSFDLPPGRSTHSFEFQLPVGGGLLAASGHLHDYGVEVRLEEAETGRVLTSLKPERDRQGRVLGMEQKIYRRLFKLLDARLRLEAGVRYRIVGVYDNPTGHTIPDGGMAHISGIFAPDDLAEWPELDPSAEAYRVDVAALPPPLGGAHVHP